ncbi:acetyl-CoA--acetoacetyl-CoA transferase subunit alpha, partial [Escherichia coli]|nr:acetyl-CoA--acetoacetyl-CoA transferase subunit alpha [Escherichia coli]
LLERPLRADLALIRAHRCDTLGNLTYQLSARNFNPLIALAADITLVEPDELVETGELQPDHIVTPGAVIDHIIVSQESK